MKLPTIVVFFALLVGACSGSSSSSQTVEPTTAPTSTPVPTATPVPVDEVDINHLQVIGSHNSYHLIPEPAMFGAILGLSPELAESIEYSHLPLTEQLQDFGIRQLEIDIFADPDGGLFSMPAANPLVGLPAESTVPELQEPGYKVLHTQDFDYATTCPTLVLCLTEVKAWSDTNPNHLPVMIMLEIKSQSVPDAAAEEGLTIDLALAWAQPLAPTVALLDALDAEIRSVFGDEQLITPDQVRGTAATLEEAVLTVGWPTVASSRGKVLFGMSNPGLVRDLYVQDHPNLEGRAIFTDSTPGNPDAAFVRFDNPEDPGIEAAATAGYLIRTRTDSPTEDARINNTARRDTALATGAHFLSTDYYVPSIYFDSPYSVELPGGVVARCNPVSAPAACTDADLTE